jgi:hypothetical protein
VQSPAYAEGVLPGGTPLAAGIRKSQPQGCRHEWIGHPPIDLGVDFGGLGDERFGRSLGGDANAYLDQRGYGPARDHGEYDLYRDWLANGRTLNRLIRSMQQLSMRALAASTGRKAL